MKSFNDLVFKISPVGGLQCVLIFENGYGVSIVQHSFSYGNEQGLYEIAVIQGNEQEWHLTYDTPVTDDVLGHQGKEDVMSVIEKVKNLPDFISTSNRVLPISIDMK